MIERPTTSLDPVAQALAERLRALGVPDSEIEELIAAAAARRVEAKRVAEIHARIRARF